MTLLPSFLLAFAIFWAGAMIADALASVGDQLREMARALREVED
jgi:hypothetical protein